MADQKNSTEKSKPNESVQNIELVKFIAPYKCYSAGDVTGFTSEISAQLIAKKLAVAYQE